MQEVSPWEDPWKAASDIARGAFDDSWFTKAIGRAIIRAVEEERERCAKIAEEWAKDIPDADQDVFIALASSIREKP